MTGKVSRKLDRIYDIRYIGICAITRSPARRIINGGFFKYCSLSQNILYVQWIFDFYVPHLRPWDLPMFPVSNC